MKFLIGLIALIIGVVNIASPETAWYLSDGWKYKDAEPTDEALLLTRVGGGAAILIGLGFMFAN